MLHNWTTKLLGCVIYGTIIFAVAAGILLGYLIFG